MKLTEQEVEKIALLARLELSEDEKETYAKQLSEVLAYFEKLQQADVKDLPITAQVTGLENVYRDDKVDEFTDREKLIEAAPESESNLIKTKSVF